MDTNEQIFQQALDDLYRSVMRVMTLARGSMTEEQKLQYIMSALSGFTQDPPIIDTGGGGGTPPPPPPPPPPPVAPTKKTLYANRAESRDSDDAWGFRNKYLDDKDGNDMNFCLYIINDDQAEYELKITDSTVDALFNDPGIAADQVVKSEGVDPAPGKHIMVKERGCLRRDGKYWIVEKKCVVTWS